MSFLDTYKHVLPRARAWALTVNKQLRQFFDGLSEFPADFRDFIDDVFGDIFPQTTRELTEWETQFNIVGTAAVTTQERRDRLDGAWKALGGQSPRYIQDILQDQGFPVFIHEWWVPGTDPPIARDPNTELLADSSSGAILAGEPLAQAGEPLAQAGNSGQTGGFVLVNKITQTRKDIVVTCGNLDATCGNEDITFCGFFEGFIFEEIVYNIPSDPDTFPFFLYIGGQIFPNTAVIPETRREEFETLCLKICPAQQWLGILVQYSS